MIQLCTNIIVMVNGIFVAKTCGGVVSEILDWVLSWRTPNGSWNI